MKLLALALLAACGGNTNAGPDASTECTASDTRADTFVVGLDKRGEAGMLDFQLMSVSPAPPARGDNTWIVQVNAMSAGVVGQPVNGATMNAVPYMPDHAHGTGIEVVVTPTTTTGQYQLKPVNMWMPGYWETTVHASTASASDTAVFKFCIPE